MARESAPDTTAAYDGFAIRRGRVGPPRASRYGLRPSLLSGAGLRPLRLGLRLAALGLAGGNRPISGVLGDELLGLLTRQRIGPLVVRRLHQVARGAVELAR